MDPETDRERRERVATALARRQMPGKAICRLIDPGLAPNTPEVEDLMRKKFLTPPLAQAGSTRLAAPVANEVSEESVVHCINASSPL